MIQIFVTNMTLTKIYVLIVLVLLKVIPALGNVIYVAPTGNDYNTGDINEPLESISRAQELVNPGDTVYIRGGVYNMRIDQVSQYYSIWAWVTKLSKSGTETAPINYWAYPNEKPIFDYTNIKPADKRVIAFYVSGSWLHIKGIEITGVQVTIKGHTQSECFRIERGNNNLLEQISMHDGMAIGIYILKGSDNLILNCDAYRNWDSVSEGGEGGNVDGFGCHVSRGHVNNVFRGCRAWLNSDDGFDLINCDEPVLIDSCWAFYNGYSEGFISRGDGNGFKAGGYGGSSFSSLPNPIPINTIRFCLAVANKQSGFYSNHHLNGSKWLNNTAYKNKRNFNLLNREAPTEDGYLKDVPGWGHLMRNNLGYEATYLELANIDKMVCDLSHNYFDLDIEIDDSDFLSLDESALTASRKVDGSLPEITFLHLNSGSDLIDKGINVGFPFKGIAPDLGCFESDISTQIHLQTEMDNLNFRYYPNPFSKVMEIAFTLNEDSEVDISIINLHGNVVRTIGNKRYPKGKNTIFFERNDMPHGAYLLHARLGEVVRTGKFITTNE
jgi:hypothetical protein